MAKIKARLKTHFRAKFGPAPPSKKNGPHQSASLYQYRTGHDSTVSVKTRENVSLQQGRRTP